MIDSIGDFEKMPAQQGWQCPICGRVYSPTTMMCLYCGNGNIHASTTYTYVDDSNAHDVTMVRNKDN